MKKFSLIILTPILLIVLAVAALLLFVDPNQFKPLIVEQTKKHTQLDLTIEGDIGWKFFPSIGFTLGRTTLSNPQGFSSPNMLSVDEVGLDISVLPLLDKELQVGNVTLKGAQIYLETKADGSSNLDVFTAPATEETAAAEQASTETAPAETAPAEPWTISLQGANIENALLEIKDDSAGLYTKLEKVNLNVASFEFDQWTPVTFSFEGVNNEQKFAISGQANAKTNADFTDYQIKDVSVNGSFSQPDFDLQKFELNLDQFALGSFANVKLTANGVAAGNKFDMSTALQAKLEKDLKTFAVQEVALQASLDGPELDIERVTLDLNRFSFGEPGTFQFGLKSKLADMTQNLVASGNLLVDEAISKVSVNSLQMNGTVEGKALPQTPMSIGLESDLSFDLNKSHLDLVLAKLALNDLQFDGSTQVTLADIPKVRFKLHSPEINVDEWTGAGEQAPAEQGGASSGSSTSGNQAATEPDLSALKTVDVAGTITIDKLTASNAKLQNVFTNVAIKDGVLNLKALKARLYQGSIDAKAVLNGKGAVPAYDVDAKIKGVKVGPLLKDVADNEMLEGTGNITIDLKGKSLILRS